MKHKYKSNSLVVSWMILCGDSKSCLLDGFPDIVSMMKYGHRQNRGDDTLLFKQLTFGGALILVVYVADIITSDNDISDITELINS